ncbi:MAG: hypothetical protein Q9191_000651, partial [Dirinaria sp. TL-2023a]
MLLFVQLLQIARAVTTNESMKGNFHHDSKAAQAVTAMATAGTTSMSGAQLTSSGMGPDPATPGHRARNHRREGFFAQWKKLLGLDTFVATAQGTAGSRRRGNPFSRGIITNCKDFWCDPEPYFGRRETGAAILGGEPVNYTRMYEVPPRMKKRRPTEGAEGGMYHSVDSEDVLKSPCVELSQVALRFQASKATSRDIITALENLHHTLREVTRNEFALDGKLAEYVFFPLSHVFRENKSLPIRANELALLCLQNLIAYGWKNAIVPDLAKQLLILLTVFAGGSTADAKTKDVSEELAAAAYACLTSLFRVSDTAGLSIKGVVDDANLPVIGHAVSVLLDGVANGPSVKVRLAALAALDTLISNTSDRKLLKSFFPGVVSALTKLLSGGNRSKGSNKILQGSLNVLDKTISKVVSDDAELSTGPPDRERHELAIANHGQKGVKDSWLEATSAQVKIALANVLPLRYHEKDEVRRALFRLCMTVLERCRRSLHQSVPMMVETSVVICTQSSIVDTIELLDNLKVVIATDASLLETLKNSLHDWIISLPRVMQSNDDTPKKRSVDQVSVAFDIIGSQGPVSDILNHAIASNLRSSISTAIQASASKTIQSVADSNQDVAHLARLNHFQGPANGFPEVMFTKIAQRTTVQGLRSLAKQVNVSSSATLQQDVVETLQTTSGDEQLASLWLAIQVLGRKTDHSNDISQFVDLSIADAHEPNPMLGDIYTFALSTLSESAYSTEADWRLQALSLEAIALQARDQGNDFRPELVDALYPILERMGSANAALQRHAIAALTITSQACGYPTPRELIIENVDYLVNAVALKLNTFDISPQAPQVMIMMIKLCGATLIPYLDDLVESIFAILECYHGYPKLVEQMFAVLNAIVEESNKASAPAITNAQEKGSP